MKVTLIGVNNIEAFQSQDGNVVDGVKLFIAYPDEHTYGNATDNKYIQRNVFDSFGVSLEQLLDHIGQVIDVEVNFKKKVVGIRI